jgi:SsrA-binding protein
MKDSHARVDRDGNLDLMNFHIHPYEFGNRYNTEPNRPRRLLLHRKQIAKFSKGLTEKGTALVPLRIYFKNGRAKVELGLGKGKNQADKRESLKKKDADREAQRILRAKNR